MLRHELAAKVAEAKYDLDQAEIKYKKALSHLDEYDDLADLLSKPVSLEEEVIQPVIPEVHASEVRQLVEQPAVAEVVEAPAEPTPEVIVNYSEAAAETPTLPAPTIVQVSVDQPQAPVNPMA
jgi:hypothetical protein